jgi:antitoxin CptB
MVEISAAPIKAKRTTLMTEQEKQRLRWGCRRGMLELDLIFSNFFEQQFSQLQPSEQTAFSQLIACDDNDLIAWLLGYSTPSSPFCHIIEVIKDYAKNKSGN